MIKTAAKQYIRDRGWAIVPIPPGTKGPNQDGWQKPENLLTTEEACDTLRNGWNIGVQHEESGTVVLDIDNIEYTKIIFESFGLDYDTILKGAARTIGKEGHDKAFFKAPDGVKLTTHKLAWPHPTEINKKSGKRAMVVVIEFRGGTSQDVLPPSIHPDTKKPYEWSFLPDTLPELPREILNIWKEWDKYLPRMRNLCPWDKKEYKPPTKRPRRTTKPDAGVIQQYNDKHSVHELLSYYNYVQKAPNRYLSPFSSTGLAGVIVFPDGRVFSHHGSDPWACEHSLDAFDLFCQMEHNGNLNAAIEAARCEFNIPSSVDLQTHGAGIAAILTKKKPPKDLPDYLTTIPGILQEVVDYYNATAKKPQPQFAVSAALALGSVILGRRYVTDQDNYSSLYIANLGKTSAGKEHALTVIEEILTRAGVDEKIMGPTGYHSSGALFTALENQPNHLTVIDELGLHFQSNNMAQNSNKLDAQRAVMECFGRLGGRMRPMGYSRMTLTPKQKELMETKIIYKPAITILGMSTPDTVYQNINLDSIASGFIPRFIFVESISGRPHSRRLGERPTLSKELIRWVQTCFSAHAGDGNLVEDFGYNKPPEPIMITFEPEALDRLDEYEERIINRQNVLDKHRISGLLGKTVEIAHRVALIFAVSCGHACIYTEDVERAILFVDHYAIQTEKNIINRVYGSEFEGACKEVYTFIYDAGQRGATDYEIVQGCHKYRALEPIKRKAVMEVVPSDYNVQFVNISHGAKGGRPRQAYIAVEFINKSEN